jgi:hypothetical protein
MMNTHNHIPEDIQWQIFELLEGNLTENESHKIQELIRSNTSYQTFYRELSLTYLKPEATEFPNKSALLKTSAGTFKVWRNLTILLSSAAAVALLILNNDTPGAKYPHSSNTVSSKLPSAEKKTEPTISLNKKTDFKTAVITLRTTPSAKLQSIQKDTHPISSFINSDHIAKSEMITNKPFRVIRINEDASQDFTSPGTQENSDFASINAEPEIQIVYTGFEDDETEITAANQTEFLLDVAQNLRYGRLPKMQLVPRKRQNHLIPQVDMRVGTNTRFIQTTLIQ